MPVKKCILPILKHQRFEQLEAARTRSQKARLGEGLGIFLPGSGIPGDAATDTALRHAAGTIHRHSADRYVEYGALVGRDVANGTAINSAWGILQ